jgi:translocation and assembly module TamB
VRAWRAVVHAHAAATLFAAALVGGALLHLALLPMFSRVLVATVNEGLEPIFLGRVAIDRVRKIRPTGVVGLDGHVDDAQGHRLLTIEGIDARLSTLLLLRSLAKGHGPIAIDIPALTVARADLSLDADSTGVPRIAGAFQARSTTPGTGRGRGVRLALPYVHVVHATLRVQPSAPYDADLDDADVSVLVADGAVAVDLGRGQLTVRGLPRDAQARGIARGHFEQSVSGPPVVRASWEGTAGAITERADMALRGEDLDVSIDVSPVGSAEVCALLPEWPIAAVCGAHAEAHGTLPRLMVDAHASIGGGTLDVAGPVTLGPATRATLHLSVQRLDGRAFVSPVPCDDIDLAGDVTVAARETGDLEGHASFALAGAQCGTRRVPPTALTADFSRTAQGDTSGHADLAIHQPGAPALLSLSVSSGTGASELSFEGSVSAARLEQVAPLGGSVRGSASVRATGKIDFRARTIDAQAWGELTSLSGHRVSAGSARIEAHAFGQLAAPSVDLQLDAERVSAPAVELSAVHAQGQMTIEGGVALHEVRIDFAGEGPPIHLRVALARLLDGGARIDGALVEGLGEPLTAELRASAASVTVRAKSAGIDLDRVASFSSFPIHRGKLSLDLDTTVTAGAAEGRIDLGLSHAAFGSLRDVNAQLEAVLHGRRGYGRASATADDIGTLEAHSTSISIGKGGLLTAAPWRTSWGALTLDARADLAKLAARLPKGAMPFESLQGGLEVTARVARDSAVDMTPEVEVTVRTTGLVVARRGAWRVAGVDPVLRVVVNGQTGETSVDAKVQDALGPLATLKASSTAVPYEAILSDARVADALLSMPFSAELEIPSRPLDSLPAAMGLGGRRGDLLAKVGWKGSVAEPTVDIVADLTRGPADPRLVALPVDLALNGHYDGSKLDATLTASQHGVQVAEASAQISVRARDWLAHGIEAAWVAAAKAKLDRFPLRSLEVLDDRQVRGTVSGDLSLDGLHDDAKASAVLDFESLQVGEVNCKSSRVSASVDGRSLQAEATLDQSDGGSFVAEVRAGARWGRALLPRIDTAATTVATLKAKQFRATLLSPFTPGLTELDGRIDADASLEIDSEHQVVRPSGTLTLKDGIFELASMGSEFHAASARATLTPDGVIRIQDASARGPSGLFTASATAWMSGLSIGGASASVKIPDSEPIPLVFGGVQLGKVDGRLDMTMKRSAHENDVDVNVPSMTLDLSSGSSNHDVQALGDIEGLRVGRLQSSEFVVESLDAAHDEDSGPSRRSGRPATIPTVIDVHLGSDVEVRKGTDLDVRLEGQPRVTLGNGINVSGQIRLQRGTINVQGKPFEIERGTVAFVGDDPSNPQVVLAAGWSAPDGTRIYADFVGPLKTGKVTLRSEPARPQNEILALILFGTTDQQGAGSGGGTPQATTVAAAAGGVATQPLNQALGGVNHALDKLGLAGGISTKVDTSTPNPRPEVQVQIARDISVQVAWVLGAIPPGTNPDTTLVTLSWRFLRQWALETTVGDQASSIVDVVWQHRY